MINIYEKANGFDINYTYQINSITTLPYVSKYAGVIKQISQQVNIASAVYKLNGSIVTLPFEVNINDVISVQITKTNDALESLITLTAINHSQATIDKISYGSSLGAKRYTFRVNNSPTSSPTISIIDNELVKQSNVTVGTLGYRDGTWIDNPEIGTITLTANKKYGNIFYRPSNGKLYVTWKVDSPFSWGLAPINIDDINAPFEESHITFSAVSTNHWNSSYKQILDYENEIIYWRNNAGSSYSIGFVDGSTYSIYSNMSQFGEVNFYDETRKIISINNATSNAGGAMNVLNNPNIYTERGFISGGAKNNEYYGIPNTNRQLIKYTYDGGLISSTFKSVAPIIMANYSHLILGEYIAIWCGTGHTANAYNNQLSVFKNNPASDGGYLQPINSTGTNYCLSHGIHIGEDRFLFSENLYNAAGDSDRILAFDFNGITLPTDVADAELPPIILSGNWNINAQPTSSTIYYHVQSICYNGIYGL